LFTGGKNENRQPTNKERKMQNRRFADRKRGPGNRRETVGWKQLTRREEILRKSPPLKTNGPQHGRGQDWFELNGTGYGLRVVQNKR